MTSMDANEYQQLAHRTAVYPEAQAAMYCALGLASEAGEVAGHLKRVLRDDDGTLTPDRRQALLDELGDVLWYIAELTTALEADLGDVMARNVEKLASRAERGAIHGRGSDR